MKLLILLTALMAIAAIALGDIILGTFSGLALASAATHGLSARYARPANTA